MSFPLSGVFSILGGVVVGVVGVGLLIAEHFRQERRQHAATHELNRLNERVSSLQCELDRVQLRGRQPAIRSRAGNNREQQRSTSSNASTTSRSDYASASDNSRCRDVINEDKRTPTTLASLDTVLKDIDEMLENAAQLDTAFAQLEELLESYPNNPKILWRMGRARFQMSLEVRGGAGKMEHLNAGAALALRAVNLAPNDGEAHKWYAILVGARCQHQDNTEKVKGASIFKKHVDRAIKLIPKDAHVHHLLGRFSIEIASITWWERKFAEAFFGTLPQCSLEDGLRSLLKADRLAKKASKMNKFWIGKCHTLMGNYTDAIKWLDEAKAIVSTDMVDDGVDEEIDALAQQYFGYRVAQW